MAEEKRTAKPGQPSKPMSGNPMNKPAQTGTGPATRPGQGGTPGGRKPER